MVTPPRSHRSAAPDGQPLWRRWNRERLAAAIEEVLPEPDEEGITTNDLAEHFGMTRYEQDVRLMPTLAWMRSNGRVERLAVDAGTLCRRWRSPAEPREHATGEPT